MFKFQVTQAVLDLFEEHNFAVTFFLAIMALHFWLLDLPVNGYAKKYLKRKLNDWYTDQFYQQYEEKKNSGDWCQASFDHP